MSIHPPPPAETHAFFWLLDGGASVAFVVVGRWAVLVRVGCAAILDQAVYASHVPRMRPRIRAKPAMVLGLHHLRACVGQAQVCDVGRRPPVHLR
jgi:hypothetical protein